MPTSPTCDNDLVSELCVPQVFRTYNASITLDALLNKESTASTVDEKKAEYDRANKEVCGICAARHH